MSSFQGRYTKFERFLAKNQHTKRKVLNFGNWCSGKVSKIGHHFRKYSVLEIDDIKNISNKPCAPKIVFFNNEKIRNIQKILTKKIDFESQILALLETSPLHQFLTKFFLNFVSIPWKLDNLYYHREQDWCNEYIFVWVAEKAMETDELLLIEITPKTLLSRAVTLDSKYKALHRVQYSIVKDSNVDLGGCFLNCPKKYLNMRKYVIGNYWKWEYILG